MSVTETTNRSELDRYHDLKDARDKARRAVTAIATELRSLSDDITDFENRVRLNEPHVSRAPLRTDKHILGPERLPQWERLAAALPDQGRRCLP